MAKTSKSKRNRPVSIHSRAAKRETSPGIDLDKSLKSIKAPEETPSRPLALGTQHGAGITKKKSKGKPLSRQKRMRLEKGIQRAEAVLDQQEKKVENSARKGKVVKDRSGAWEDVNDTIHSKTKKKQAVKRSQDDEWEDEDSITDGEVVDGVTALKVDDGQGTAPEPKMILDPDDGDEIS